MTSMLEPPKMIGSYSKNLTEKREREQKNLGEGGWGPIFRKAPWRNVPQKMYTKYEGPAMSRSWSKSRPKEGRQGVKKWIVGEGRGGWNIPRNTPGECPIAAKYKI